MDGLIVTKGPELPWKFYRHCATQINSTHGILIGGQGRLKGSLIVDLNNNFQMSTGPDLIGIGRRDHMCTKFSYMNGNYVLVAGGKDLDNIPNLTTNDWPDYLVCHLKLHGAHLNFRSFRRV